MTNGAPATTERSAPGLIAFAAIMMFVLGGVHALWAIGEFADNLWLVNTTNGIFGDDLWAWGIYDAIVAVLLFTGAASVLAGGEYGRWVGIVFAVFAAIRWLFWIPVAPVAGVVGLIVALVVIYGLGGEWDWFDQRSRAQRR